MIQEVKTPITSEMVYNQERLRLEVQNSVSTYKPNFSKTPAEKEQLKKAKSSYLGGLESFYGKNFMSIPEQRKAFKNYGLNRPDIKKFILN